MKKDIETKEDVVFMVEEFYQKVNQSAMLRPFFQKLDWGSHLPKMVHFWCFVLFDTPGYQTNVTQIHLSMNLSEELFNEWLTLFFTTVDTFYCGENAQKVKERAALIGWTIKAKIP
jgi:hemoglobin